MIDYTTAKALKDAGFPLAKASFAYSKSITRKGWQYESRGMIEQNQNFYCGEILPAPILEELIDACGDKFLGLYPPWSENGNGMWFADAKYPNFGKGPTPEIALSKLYIALNTKTV